jgi:hypothetical protein
MEYWENRISEIQLATISAAFKIFRKGSKSRNAQNILYAELTDNGVTAEEADEIINLELEEE